MKKTEHTRYLIVGSGVAGSLLAERLLAAGKGPVTILEAGPSVIMRDRRTWLDYVMAKRLPYDGLGDAADDYEALGKQSWRIEGGRLFARGGSTLHWGGWCPRMKPEDFQLESRIGSGGLDWPFGYEMLAPYYVRAEHYLQVAGDSKENDPPRGEPYPFEAPAFTQVDGEVIAALEKLGIGYGHIPVARNARPINGQPACVTTGTCGYCPIGGRFTGDQPLDRLKPMDSFRLVLGAPVTRVLMNGRKRATGVEYRDLASGKRRRMRAETVVLCAGALETPKLLLASANRHWPRGLGNDSDQVGRYLVANPYFYARASRPDNPRRLQEELHFATLGSRHWDSPQYQRTGKFFLNRASSPDLEPARLMGQGKTADEIQSAARGTHVLELQGAMQTFCHAENRVLPARGKNRFGLPRTRIETPVEVVSSQQIDTNLERMRRILEAMGYTMLAGEAGMGVYPQRGDHAMCTCRISESPKKGVVDSDLKVHGTDNLYILSNAVFPSGTPANPTLTLAALALRFADALTRPTR